MRYRVLFAAFVVMLAAALAHADASKPNFPDLTGRVVDDAGVLSPQTIDQLTTLSADHERSTGQQVVVVTVKSLQGYSIEDFGYQLGRQWGIGQKGRDNGAILLVAPNEHKVRIEVGYGLEGILTDAQSRIIIEHSILPEFRRGDFNTGVLDGMQSILQVVGGNPLAEEAPVHHVEFHSTFAVILFLSVWIITFLGPFVVLFLSMVRYHRQSGRWFHPGWSLVGGGSSSGSSSWGDGGGGGFSGGGGSFGGGGASGSW